MFTTRDHRLSSTISLDSEKSYNILFKKSELYEAVAYLIFDLIWMFVAAFANVIIFVLYSYEVTVLANDIVTFVSNSVEEGNEQSFVAEKTGDEFERGTGIIISNHHRSVWGGFPTLLKMVFNPLFGSFTIVFITILICDAILIADIVAAIIHWTWRRYAVLKDLQPRNINLIIIDLISVGWMGVDLIPQLRSIKWIAIIAILFASFRLYRVSNFFYVVSHTPGFSTFNILLEKYGVIVFLTVHTCSCIIQSMGCYNCYEDERDWTSTVNSTIYFDGPTPSKWYIICLYFILGTVSSVGFGDIHAVSDSEMVMMTTVMLISFFLIVGSFLGAMTKVQVESYWRHSTFATRLDFISKSLDHPRVSKALKTKIMNYYYKFWQQQKGIRFSYIFTKLPEALQQQVYMDKYWNALRQTYLLKSLHPAFLRAVATTMTTEIFTAGEVIFHQGYKKNYMVYVLRGSVQILSAEDGESTILTLGMGTCIGEINLIYSFPSPVQVVASSYCEIQRLTKVQFWRVAVKYYKLNQISIIHERLRVKIDFAVESVSDIANADMANYMVLDMMSYRPELEQERTLKLVKAKLNTENPKLASYAYVDHRRKLMNTEEHEKYSDLYILSLHQTTLRHSDEIFLRTSWPWVLQPQSQFLTIWEYFICSWIMVVLMVYPYYISFSRTFTSFTTVVNIVLIDIFYVLDVILQIFTAIEDQNGIISKVSDIFIIRCQTFPFIVDVISCLPLSTLAYLSNMTHNERILTILSVNRVLKINRVIILFKKLGASFDINVAVVRCTKYVLYFMLLSYLMGAVFYMLACFNVTCLEHSWINVIEEEDKELGETRHLHTFELSIYFAAIVTSQTGYGDITPHTITEAAVTMIFFVGGSLLFCYLVADYSATVMLAERPRENYIEMVSVIKKFLISNKMLLSIQHRTDEYLALQWRINKGYTILKTQSVLFDAPHHLYGEQQIAKYLDSIERIPLFKEIDKKFLNILSGKVKPIMLPPNEIVIYAGEVVRHVYVVDRGFCEMISAASGKTEKVLGPRSHFCDFDMLLEQPGIHHIRTVTHTRIIKISYVTVKKILMKAGEFEHLKQLAEEVKASLPVKRLFLRRESVTYKMMEEEQRKSWFVFPHNKLHPRSVDYEKAFDNMGVWKVFKAILLRRTVLPDGNFLLIWELIQAFRIFIMSMYYISLTFFNAYSPIAGFAWICFDLLGVIDMFIHMHICYYNEHGILVTHPKLTAIHYFTSSFVVDICSIIPTHLIIKPLLNTKSMEKQSLLHQIEIILRLNKMLQIYRILGAFSYFEGDTLKARSIFLYILKFLPLSIVFFNALAMILISMTCSITGSADGLLIIKPNPHTWIGVEEHKRRFNVSEPINLYISAYYWVALTGLQVGYGNFQVWQVSEIFFIIFVVVAGYLFFTYILVQISSCESRINVNLTLYQEHMKHLIVFMRKERINKELQNEVINHFEYIWQRTHGMKASKILKKCHLALHKDSVLYLYEQTFMQVPVFIDLGKSFYRLLGMHVEEAYFLQNSTIIRLNDIIDTLYIVHRGKVTVRAPDGSVFSTLTRGCLFGNIDNVSTSRSMTSFIASSAVDLICINTKELYNVAEDYPVVANRIRRHILMENASYIEKKIVKESPLADEEESVTKTSTLKRSSLKNNTGKLEKHISTLMWLGLLPLPMMLMSFMSCLVILYHLAFQNHSYLVFTITYLLDVIHCVKIYSGFRMPYRNSMGEIITDRAMIRKRFLKPTRFYLQLLANFPFEICALAAPSQSQLYYVTWLRINRTLRVWNIYQFFNVSFDRLNINVIIIKLGSVCIYFTLLIHMESCLLYMVACPAGICLKKCWLYNDDGELRDNNHYLMSMYFLVSIITCTGYGDIAPGTPSEMVASIGLVLFAQFVLAVFIGDISAMVQNYSYTFGSYDYNMMTLKKYLQYGYIAGPLVDRVMNYVNQLWRNNKGLQFPVLLQEAPSCMIHDVKVAAYGKHFYENYLFIACHDAFLRQLVSKVKATIFFRGDIICQQGDINNTMYFIHKGIVNVYVIDGYNEIQVGQLGELDCLGLVQGLFAQTPYTHTYKAETVGVVLALNLTDWVHLLKYYRAARFEIYTRIKETLNEI